MNRPIFIAEIKTQSPFGYKSAYSFRDLLEASVTHGDWVSVHDNALWGGDYETLSFVRRNTQKPILAKGLHATDDDIRRALDHGATYVLVVDRFPNDQSLWDKCLFEWSSIDKLALKVAPENIPWWNRVVIQKHVYNARDLRTGKLKHLSVNPVVHNNVFKVSRISGADLDCIKTCLANNMWLCQASGITSPDDVVPGVSAFIVGEHLVEFCKQVEEWKNSKLINESSITTAK